MVQNKVARFYGPRCTCMYVCTDWAYYPPVFKGPRGEGGTGATGQAGQPGPVPADDSGTEKVDSDTDSTTNVRSNFPETWIWTEAMTGCVIRITLVFTARCIMYVCMYRLDVVLSTAV